MASPAPLTAVPDHVPQDRIVDYDYTGDARVAEMHDFQLGLHKLHADAPDVFYSPRNGGFWMVTRLDMMSKVLSDTEHFSNRVLEIPRIYSDNVMIPLTLDPPDHLPFRMVLMRHFSPARIRSMEPGIREWANRLIDAVIDRGECEFGEEVGAAFPVSVFMQLVGWSMDRFEEFRAVVQEFFRPDIAPADRVAVQNQIIAIVAEYFELRRKEPGDDLFSKLVTEEVRGRPLTTEELHSIGFLLFIAGLDTVANTLGFAFNHLAQRHDIQDRLASDSSCIGDFVEESLRRFSIVQQPRIVKKEVTMFGVTFMEEDMVVCSLPAAGLDDRTNPDPEHFDVDREARKHIAFSTGPHTCVGNFLARTEMRIFTEEWVRRIPRFSRKAGSEPTIRTGGVAALHGIHLEWPVP